MSSEVAINQALVPDLKQQLFMSMHGIEVLENMQFGPERERFHPEYLAQRQTLVEKLFLIQAVSSNRHKSAKGELLQGLGRAVKQDFTLLPELMAQGIERVDVLPVPFAHSREVARLLGIIQPSLAPKDDLYGHTRRVSKFQYEFARSLLPEVDSEEELTEKLREQKRAVVIQMEGSILMVYPVKLNGREISVPVIVRGPLDLGASAIFNFAVHPVFRNAFFGYHIIGEPDLEQDEDSNKFRELIHDPKANFDDIFCGDTKIVLTKDGKEVEAKDLTDEEKRKIVVILRKSTAPFDSFQIHNDMLRDFEQKLKLNYVVNSQGEQHPISPRDKRTTLGERYDNDDESLFGFVSGALNLSRFDLGKRFRSVRNPKLLGPKTLDLDYFLYNPIAKKYPQIFNES